MLKRWTVRTRRLRLHSVLLNLTLPKLLRRVEPLHLLHGLPHRWGRLIEVHGCHARKQRMGGEMDLSIAA
jgi:hypothetical protein